MLNTLRRAFSVALRLGNRVFSGKVLSVRAICFDEVGRIFLVRHTYTRGWHLPGGGVANGLSAYEALEKELREEGNLVMVSSPHLQQLFFHKSASQREHIALYTVMVKQNSEPKRSMEIAEGRFFASRDLPEDIDAPTAQRILEIRTESILGTVW